MNVMITRRFLKKGICGLLVLLISGFFPHLVISKEPAYSVKQTIAQAPDTTELLERDWQKNFEQHITHWVQQIGSMDPLFLEWLSSSWESLPLGPGSKQWVVLLSNQQGKEIGYLIITESDSGELLLLEYGKNEEEILSHYFLQKEATKAEWLYYGLAWLEKKEGQLYDLVTSEVYEHVQYEEVLGLETKLQGASVNRLTEIATLQQDPERTAIAYFSERSKEKAAQTIPFKSNQSYFYTAEIIPKVRGIYDVVSIHYWETNHQDSSNHSASTEYIGLENYGVRYFSVHYLESLGGVFNPF